MLETESLDAAFAATLGAADSWPAAVQKAGKLQSRVFLAAALGAYQKKGLSQFVGCGYGL